MGAPPINVPAMRATQMISQLAKQAPGQGGSGGAGSPDAAGRQLSQQMAELQGADPQLLVKAGEQVKAMLGALYTKTMFQVPGASRQAAKAVAAVDAMLKELQQAAATVNTVNSPIVNSAGMPPTQMGGPGGPGADGGQEGQVA